MQSINEQTRLSRSSVNPPAQSLFGGFLRCADCGNTLSASVTRRTGENGAKLIYRSYQCSRYALTGSQNCFSHTIQENALKQLLLDNIKRQAQRVSIDRDKVAAEIMSRLSVADKSYTIERIKRLNAKLRELGQKQARLYEDKVSGVISPQTFTLLTQECKTERGAAEDERRRLLEEQAENEKSTRGITEWMERISEYGGVHDINRDMLGVLVDRIEIGKPDREKGIATQSIKIFYRHIGEL